MLSGLVLLLSPFILAKKLLRTLRKGSTHELDPGRFFLPKTDVRCPPRTGGRPRIVLYGPSLGELRLVQQLSRMLCARRPDLDIVWCSGDRGTIAFSRENFPAQPIVISPYENAYSVGRWLDLLEPDAIVLMEKFWLPHLLSAAKLRGCRTAVVNARTNRKDKGVAIALRPYYQWIARNVDLFCFQAADFRERVRPLEDPSQSFAVTGNLKLDVVTDGLERVRESLAAWMGQSDERTPIFAAGSTGSEMDESFVLEAFEAVRKVVDCRLLIAPRKIKRSDDVEREIEQRDLRVSRRSSAGTEDPQVFVLDTLGELMAAYSLCESAFIGDTLIGAGHNILEPLAWHIPVAYGPSRGHFEDLQLDAEAAEVGFRCHTPAELAEVWLRSVQDPSFRSAVADRAQKMLAKGAGATQRTVDALLSFI